MCQVKLLNFSKSLWHLYILMYMVTGFTEAPVEQMCLGASCDNTSTVLKADGRWGAETEGFKSHQVNEVQM